MLEVAIPIVVVFLCVVSFEVAMGITISTLPRSRMQQRWTQQESRRVLRVFASVFSVWPTLAAIALGHLYLPLYAAILLDAVVLAAYAIGICWLIHGIKRHRQILKGHCANCFYDLRASTGSDHCPECGAQLRDHPVRSAVR